MIRRHLMVLRLALAVSDAVLAALVFVVVSLVRFGDGHAFEFWEALGIDLGLAAVLWGVVWVSTLWTLRLYELRIRWSLWTEAQDIAKATLLLPAVVLSFLYLVGESGVSRVFLAMLFVVQPLITFSGRAFIRLVFGAIRHRGFNKRYMLVAGTGTLAQDFADRVEDRSALGIDVIGHLSVPGEPGPLVSRPILGTIGEMGAVLHSRVVDEIAVCLPPSSLDWTERVAERAADEGKVVRIPIEPLRITGPNTYQEEFDGFVVRSMVFGTQRDVGLIVKRLLDIAVAGISLLILSPVLLAVAIAIRAHDGSPVLFRQLRVGLHGRLFTMYKFRTMTVDAEARLDGLWAQNPIAGPALQLADDPRVTPLGAKLRRASLDELPQLWNVLRGQMSIVGPRPAPVVEVARYDDWHRRRLSVKPGITGLAQITIRRYEKFDDRAQLDMRYIDGWSIGLDLRIIARTFVIVFAGTGQ